MGTVIKWIVHRWTSTIVAAFVFLIMWTVALIFVESRMNVVSQKIVATEAGSELMIIHESESVLFKYIRFNFESTQGSPVDAAQRGTILALYGANPVQMQTVRAYVPPWSSIWFPESMRPERGLIKQAGFPVRYLEGEVFYSGGQPTPPIYRWALPLNQVPGFSDFSAHSFICCRPTLGIVPMFLMSLAIGRVFIDIVVRCRTFVRRKRRLCGSCCYPRPQTGDRCPECGRSVM